MLRINVPKRWDQWLKAAVAAFVSSGANAGLALLGIGGAAMAGIPVKPLDLHQFFAISLSGGVVGLWMYLAKSPVPPDATGNTDVMKKP
jgi:hypothetical protein